MTNEDNWSLIPFLEWPDHRGIVEMRNWDWRAKERRPSSWLTSEVERIEATTLPAAGPTRDERWPGLKRRER